MLRYPFKRFVPIVALAVMVTTLTTPAAATEPEKDRVAQEQPDDPGTGTDAREARWPSWPGRSCTFRARADNPHLSGNDASGHGTWVNTSNPLTECPKQAEVTVKLQAYGCWYVFPYPVCSWVTHGTRTEFVKSKGQVAVHYENCPSCVETKRPSG